MSAPSYDDLPPPYRLGDVIPLYTKYTSSPGLDSAPNYLPDHFCGHAYTSVKTDKSSFVLTSEAAANQSPPVADAEGEALINALVPDRAPSSRTVLMTHTDTCTSRTGEHSHVVAWLWLEDEHIYYGRRAAPGLYDEAGPSPAIPSAVCVDGLVLPRMKEGYHKASQDALGTSSSRLAGRDTGPALCAHDPSSSPSSIELDHHEIAMYERLWGSPHPNVTKYHGVSTYDGEYITGIRVSASKLTLKDALLDQPFMRLGPIERGLYAGIDHLHSRRIRHNNINMSSVRTNYAGGAVIADLRFATLINPEENVDMPSMGGGLKGWLHRRHDPDYTAARHLMREARTLRLYAMGRFIYWKACSAIRAAVTDGKAFMVDVPQR